MYTYVVRTHVTINSEYKKSYLCHSLDDGVSWHLRVVVFLDNFDEVAHQLLPEVQPALRHL